MRQTTKPLRKNKHAMQSMTTKRRGRDINAPPPAGQSPSPRRHSARSSPRAHRLPSPAGRVGPAAAGCGSFLDDRKTEMAIYMRVRTESAISVLRCMSHVVLLTRR